MADKAQEEEPLDPAVEAIRVKMVRLLMVSGGIMMLGLMAVLAVIVYKVSGGEGEAVDIAAPATGPARSGYMGIPKGANIVSAAPDGQGLLVTLRKADGTYVIQRHNSAGQLVATYSIIEE